jgi:hypothetical protein
MATQAIASAKETDWTKPAPMAIPKEGHFKFQNGRYGAVYPRSCSSYGFTIIAKIKPGREEVIREYGKIIEKTIAGLRTLLRCSSFTICDGFCSTSVKILISCTRESLTRISINTRRRQYRCSPGTASTLSLRISRDFPRIGKQMHPHSFGSFVNTCARVFLNTESIPTFPQTRSILDIEYPSRLIRLTSYDNYFIALRDSTK